MAKDRGDAPGRELDPQASGTWDRNGSVDAGVGVLDPHAEPAVNDVAPAGEQREAALEGSSSQADDPTSFPEELVGAMRAVVAREHVRLVEYAERQRQAHLARVRAADAAAEQQMRQTADENEKAIEAWVAAETARIEREAEQRRTGIREDLESGLASHRSTFDAAVERVESAIATFRSEVDRYFAELEDETDVVRLASQATRRPVFPALDDLPSGMAGGSMPPAPAAEATPAAEGTSVADAESAPEAASAAPAAGVATGNVPEERAGPGSVLQAVPVLRPMTTWMRRDQDGDDVAADGGDAGTPDAGR